MSQYYAIEKPHCEASPTGNRYLYPGLLLNQLENRNKHTLIWLLGHEGIEGNETADNVAKEEVGAGEHH